MISKLQTPAKKLVLSALALACTTASLAGCADPKVDKIKSEGGIAPDPTGIVSGTVLYVGPRPVCEFSAGQPLRVRGRVVMTMFEYDNPPPPEGRATSALNINFVNGSELFNVSDCRAEGAEVDLSERITRLVAFSWPQIALEKEREKHYQVRAFYDTDEDMLPFFSVKNLPTAGDVAGAALVDPQDATKGFLDIVMPPLEGARGGYERSGVTVALGNYVWMERPAFEPSADNRFLNAEKPVAVVPNSTGTGADPAATVLNTWRQSCEAGAATPDCGFRLNQLTQETAGKTFEAANVQLDFAPDKYAFISEPVDILTVRKDDVDLMQPDGKPDPHPLLGANAGVPWFTPIVIMTRSAPTPAMESIEKRAGIPGVRLIGSTLLNPAATGPARRMTLDSLPVAVPNVAAVELTPNPVCRVPYVAPGNYTRAYEARLAYCSDLPTGVFGMSAIHGVAGGRKLDSEESDTGFVLEGGRLSSQAWSVPNDLANPAQVGEGNQLASQGTSQLFVVHDPNIDEQGDCTRALDPDMRFAERDIEPRGLCKEGEELRLESAFDPTGIDGQGCLPQFCCDAVKHLCDRELCEVCTEETCPGLNLNEHLIRQGPTEIVTKKDGKSVPNCVPFKIPDFCCTPPA